MMFACCLPHTATPLAKAFPRQCKARVVSVYDGDTITIIMRFRWKSFQFKCRLMGIDTPELRTRNEKEKQMGSTTINWCRDIVTQRRPLRN